MFDQDVQNWWVNNMPLAGEAKRIYMKQRYYKNRKLIRCPMCGKERFVNILEHRDGAPCFNCSVKMEKGARKITDLGFAEWFWSKTILVSSGCIEWTGSYRGAKPNYGRADVDRKSEPAHKVAWMLANKATPMKGMCVCHKCDNPKCVNPEHLFLGTYSDNVQDMLAKGRDNYNNPIGEQNGKHKLTATQVAEIKDSISKGLTDITLGKQFGVNYMTIHAIKKGITWREVSV